jgi:two-component system, NarL family, nitrate/nitrite response regulator NarL
VTAVKHSSRDPSGERVLIADDHVATRVGVRLALERDGFVICAEEASGAGAVAAALREVPDICLLDVHMPGGGGIEAATAIRSRLPDTQVVMLTGSSDDDDLFTALESGATGYLLKGIDPAQLGAALRDVLRGDAALPPTLAARLIREFRARSKSGGAGLVRPTEDDLTEREWEVLDCLSEGLGTGEIANRLFITQTTVRRHVGSILKKLHVSSRQAAVEVAAGRSRNLNAE